MLIQGARIEADRKRRKELRRCQESLWYLGEQLGYRWNPERKVGLTTRLHKPLCEWADATYDEDQTGLWMTRGYHKTTLVVLEIIRDILRVPHGRFAYFHSVQELAEGVVQEVADIILKNKYLRRLDPIGIDPETGDPYRFFPAQNRKHFVTMKPTPKFTLRRPVALFSRFPTLIGKGAGGEVTGAHFDKVYGDDIITDQTVRENRQAEIERWWGHTIVPICDGRKFRIRGTMWADWGPYNDWQVDPDWVTVLIPGSSVEDIESVDWSQQHIRLTPDYTCENPVNGESAADRKYFIGRLKADKRRMKAEFGPQIMCDPSPAGEKPWSKEECEHFIDYKDAMRGRGQVFILSDPAPKNVGSVSGHGEKERKDGTKDEWAICAVKIRVNGDRLERILLDGMASRDLSKDEGFDEMCHMARAHDARYLINEAVGQSIALYEEDVRKAARRNGVRYSPLIWHNAEGKKRKGLSWTYKGKNHYFEAMASAAKMDEVLIADPATLPSERRTAFSRFLHGDKAGDLGALQQARGWRPMENGRNGLRFDDRANCWSFCMDPALEYVSPRPSMTRQQRLNESPFDGDEDEQIIKRRSRHCAA